MSDRRLMKAEYARCRRQVTALLRQVWNPVGIGGSAAVADEYDAYADGVSALLLRGGGAEAVAAYLFAVETEAMGLAGDWPRCRRAALRLVRVRGGV